MERETITTRATGQETPPAVVRETTTAVVAVGPQLSWGPIWAGVLTAFGLMFLLSVLALAAGMTAIEFNGQPAADVPVDMVAMIMTGAFLALSFFAGGFVASWTASLTDEGPAIIHGFLVWALSIVLLLVFAALGVGQLFGAAGQVFGAQFAPGQIDVDVEAVAAAFTEAAWQTVFAVVLAMAAAILGALVAIRDEVRGRDWSTAYRRR
jgi:hypothetical protein